MAVIKYGTQEFEIPDGLTVQQALEGLKGGMPELANAKLEKGKDGNYTAKVDYGRKG
jgi:hypothetical protein